MQENENTKVLPKQKELTIPESYMAVYNVIANSKNKYITRTQILSQLGQNESYYRTLNNIIHKLVVVYGCPIGSSSGKGHKGYFIIKTEADKRLAMSGLDTRVQSIIERYEAVKSVNVEQKESVQV